VIVYGINPVIEALRSGRAREVRVASRTRGRHEDVLNLARERGVPVRTIGPGEIEREARGGAHQGVAATVDETPDYSVADLVHGADGRALIVVLDGIEDPHNLGAILRTVDAAGGHGVVIQSRRAAARSGGAAKASAGAMSHVRIAEVVNISRAIEELKTLGVWTIGLAGDAPDDYDTLDMASPTALVLGAEGSGLRRLVRESCDFLARIPMHGHVDSLNVSVAAGVVLFEAVRQRSGGARRQGGKPPP
jgi:23S rRNA (guanosine2251-2'-O)-methyltransferase